MTIPVFTAAARQQLESRRLTHQLRVAVRLAELKAKKPAATVAALTVTLTDQIAELAGQLMTGDISRSAFISGVRDRLIASGQDAAAVTGLADSDVEELVAGVVADREEYLTGFADDLDGGDISETGMLARAANWAGLAWTVYQMAHIQSLPESDKAEITWKCEDDANSCDDCKALAAGSPYTLDSLPTYPADGDTACLGNCRCEVDGPGGE